MKHIINSIAAYTPRNCLQESCNNLCLFYTLHFRRTLHFFCFTGLLCTHTLCSLDDTNGSTISDTGTAGTSSGTAGIGTQRFEAVLCIRMGSGARTGTTSAHSSVIRQFIRRGPALLLPQRPIQGKINVCDWVIARLESGSGKIVL